MANENPGGGFRESFRGYNKDDVNDYIASAAKQRADSDASQRRAMAELKEKIKALESALENCKKDYGEKMSRFPDGIVERAAKFEAEAAAREAIILAQNETIAKKDEEIERLKLEISKNEDNVSIGDSGEYDKLAEKAELYDKMSERMGNLLIRANEQSDGIISDAAKRADAMICDAKLRSDELLNEAAERCAESCRSVMREAAEKLLEMSEAQKAMPITAEIEKSSENETQTTETANDTAVQPVSETDGIAEDNL